MSEKWITPPAYAKARGVKNDRVLNWIRKGELAAVNFGDGDKRPRWRISPEAIAAFEQARLTPGAKPVAPKPRRAKPINRDGIIEFY